MKLKKILLPILICASLILTSFGTVFAEETLTFETASLPEGKVGVRYDQYIYTPASSDIYQYDLVQSETDSETSYKLPEWFYTKTESVNRRYRIYGVPQKPGTYNFALKVRTKGGASGIKNYTLAINKADPLVINNEEKLPNATAGKSYSEDLSSNSLITKWKIKEGSDLPAGLMLSEGGELTGTPTANGKYTFTVVATADDQTAEKTFNLTVLEEGGCKHGDRTSYSGTPPTCKADGVAAHFHCNICECNFITDTGKKYWDDAELVTVSNHSDSNNDGKCDSCNKNMPIFKKVTNEKEIAYGGTYIIVTEIDGKYYSVELPPDNGYGRGYENQYISLCEITPNENGSFDFNHIDKKHAIMMKTEFAVEGGDLDKGSPRYGLSTVADNTRYCINSSGSSFDMYPNEAAKYGYRIMTDETTGKVLIGSVYAEWWSKPDATNDGILCAFDMTYNDKNTKLMTFFGKEYYNGEYGDYKGATMNEYPIYLYRMTDAGTTTSGIPFTVNDVNSNLNNGDFVMSEDGVISNVTELANAVDITTIESYIGEIETPPTSFSAQIYADIQRNDVKQETDDKGNNSVTSLTYSVTPKIDILGADGTTLLQKKIPDMVLNGAPITVTLCTGGMTPEQIIHYKENGTKEYFYDENSDKVKEGAKSFECEKDNEGKTQFVTFKITDFSDIKILATAEPEGRTVISTVKGTSTSDFTPKYGAKAEKPKITVTEGAPAYFDIDSSHGFWCKKNDSGSSSTLKTDTPFTEGTYYFYCQVRIDSSSGATHMLNKGGITVDVNGVKWKSDNLTVTDTFSYVWVSSPECVVTAPLDTPLQFINSASFDIGANAVGVPITSINVTDGVTGGTAPYTFSKVSGPDWLGVSSDGIISGTPSATGENESLVVRVTDSKGATADITLNVGKTNVNPKDRTVISTVKGTSTSDFTPKYGAKAVKPKITVAEGEPAYFDIDSRNGAWRKKNDSGSPSTLGVTDTFTEGTYYFSCQVRIDKESGATHMLNKDGITVDVNGVSWEVSGATINDTYSYVSVSSPDYVVTESGVYTKNEISYSDGKLIATVLESGSYNLIFSGYNSDGRLTYIKTASQSLSVGKNTITVPEDVDISKVNKVYLWKGLSSMSPVCDPTLIK